MTEATSITPARSAAFIFIFITVLLDMLALGIIIPVLPRLVAQAPDVALGGVGAEEGVIDAPGQVGRPLAPGRRRDPVAHALGDDVDHAVDVVVGWGHGFGTMAITPSRG